MPPKRNQQLRKNEWLLIGTIWMLDSKWFVPKNLINDLIAVFNYIYVIKQKY